MNILASLLLSLPLIKADYSQCNDPGVSPENCTLLYEGLCGSYNSLLDDYNGCGCGIDPCAAVALDGYSQGYHIAAVFIILVASLLGAVIPILSKYTRFIRISPYQICFGKCVGIGVVLACALVHMLQPSNESLTSACVPEQFNTVYPAYTFLYAMLAGLFMQFMDYNVLRYMTRHMQAQIHPPLKTMEEDGTTPSPPRIGTALSPGHAHDHVHSILLESGIQKTISAYLLEFGITVHSVFIGLTVGVADDPTVTALLVALVFHQFFEGVALGARIADANIPHITEFALTSIFSLAAPIGIAIGIGVVYSLNPDGESFLMIQGTFDAVCGGILLYIGYMLLLKDFPEDMEKHCTGKESEEAKRAGMFFALWLGAGLMAFIGKYL